MKNYYIKAMTKPQTEQGSLLGNRLLLVSVHNIKYNDCKCWHFSECQLHRCPLNNLIHGIYCSMFCCENKYYPSLKLKSALILTHLPATQSCHSKHRPSLPLGLCFWWNHHKQEKNPQRYSTKPNLIKKTSYKDLVLVLDF